MGSLINPEYWQFGAVIVLGLVALFSMLRSHRTLLLVIGGMLFIAGLGLTKEITQGGGVEYRTFLFPLQLRRAHSYAGLGVLLIVGLLMYAAKVRMNRTSPIMWSLMFLSIFMGVMHIYHDFSDGALTLLVACVTLIPFTFLIPTFLDTWDDLYTPVRAVVLTGGLWTVVCTIQFLINKNVILAGGDRRFCGMLGNPQHAAVFCAGIAVCGIWLALNDPKLRYRLFWLAIGASHIVFTLWTASRTGFLCITIGMSLALLSRLGRAVLFAPIIVVAVLGLVSLATSMGVQFGFERLLDTSDTRSGAWAQIISQIRAEPFVGTGPANQTYSENSFLLVWSTFGVGAFLLMLLTFLISFAIGIKLIIARFNSPAARRPLFDIIGGVMAMYWLGAMAEGYGASRISTQLVLFVLFANMASRALAFAREDEYAQDHGPGLDPASDQSRYDGYDWYDEPLPESPSRAGRAY